MGNCIVRNSLIVKKKKKFHDPFVCLYDFDLKTSFCYLKEIVFDAEISLYLLIYFVVDTCIENNIYLYQ